MASNKPRIESDEPKPPRIPQVGEVLRDLNGWTNSENPEVPFCDDFSSDWDHNQK